MRVAFAVVAALLVSGCGPSYDDVDNAAAEAAAKARQEQAKKQEEKDAADAGARARQDCLSAEAARVSDHESAIRNADTTIRTAVGVASSEGSERVVAFGLRIESLSPSNWRWVEAEEHRDDYGQAQSDRIHYEVNPSALSPEVELTTFQGMPAVRFVCRSGDCMRATGRRIRNGALEDIDERRAYNYWALDTTNRAEVVRDALAELIRRSSNAPLRSGCGNAALK